MGGSAELVEELRAGVTDERVLTAMATVPRERFVAPETRADAWRNSPLPIGAGQTISQPLVVARMLELLELRGNERVLDVGTGSGYHAALLAHLARWVWSIERIPALSVVAAANLAGAGVDNVTLTVGDGALGMPDAAPFDAINVAAAAPADRLAALEAQLAPGGRMVAPVTGRTQRLILTRCDAEGHLSRKRLERVRFVPLLSNPPSERPFTDA